MAEEDHEHDDHEHHGFAFAVPAHLAQALSGGQDRHEMQAQVAAAEVIHFLDSLGIDQLLALRRILCVDGRSASNNYFDGQVVTLLRIVHKVDAATGQPFDVSALGETPEPPAVVAAGEPAEPVAG